MTGRGGECPSRQPLLMQAGPGQALGLAPVTQRSGLAGRRLLHCPGAPAASACGQQQASPAVPASAWPTPRGDPGFQAHTPCGPVRPNPTGWHAPGQPCRRIKCHNTVPGRV